MHAGPPVTRVEGGHLVVRTEIEASDGSPLAPLEVRVPRAQADLLDPTATPGVGPLVALAAVRGEDLHVDGPVDAHLATGAQAALDTLAGWWGRGPLTVRFDDLYDAPADGDAVGLFFTRGVDSWSTLLDLLDAPPGERVTHLVSVRLASTTPPLAEAEILAGHRAVAAELGLEVVEVTSTVQAMLTPYRQWMDTVAPALVGTGLQVAGRMHRLVIATDQPAHVHLHTGIDPHLVGLLRTGRTSVVAANLERTRAQRCAHLLGSPLARRTLQVCWEGRTAGNCGRCVKCQLTMAGLAVAGDPDPGMGFDAPIDADLVRHLVLPPWLEGHVASIVEGLPAPQEELRRAWSDAWDRSNGVEPRPRWGDGGPPGLAGPSLPQRVAAALRATTGQPVAPAPAPLGWRAGTVALRPALALHDEVRALADANAERPHAWAVVEHHIRDEARDGHQADLAVALAAHHGAGPTYLPGILWAWLEPPVLDADAVRRLLRTARARLWWRAEGDLEPLRVVEAIEQGCLPLQVMPATAAAEVARDLPPALRPLVVAEGAIAELDLSPEAVARRLAPAVDHLLSGSAEHDLLAGAYA